MPGFLLSCSPKSAHSLGKVESLRNPQLRMRNEFGQRRQIRALRKKTGVWGIEGGGATSTWECSNSGLATVASRSPPPPTHTQEHTHSFSCSSHLAQQHPTGWGTAS